MEGKSNRTVRHSDNTDEICRQIETKKTDLLKLSNSCGKREDSLAQELQSALAPWTFENLQYSGLFGWEDFRTDKFTKINDCRIIIEVKKVNEKSEYGFWHALIQALIYRFLE